MSVRTIYKIAQREEWRQAMVRGVYKGAPIDLADGFIHFSTAEQVRETAARHFAGADDLVLVKVDAEKLGAALAWEPSRGGDLFPHLYGELKSDAVVEVVDLPLEESGRHGFPEGIG